MVPAIKGRLDKERIAAVGHSLGGQTVGMLLGARLTDTRDEGARDLDFLDPRIKVGVLLAAPGRGGEDLSDFAAERFTFMNPDSSTMTTRTLVVAGADDVGPHLTKRGADWHEDHYRLSPGADCLLTLAGGGHGLGDIAGYDAKETDDEDPDRFEATLRMTAAYLRSALYVGDPAWAAACEALAGPASSLGRVEAKSL